MPIKEMRDGYTNIVNTVRDNLQKNLTGQWPDDYDWAMWEGLLLRNSKEGNLGVVLDLLIVFLFRTHSTESAVNLLVALERNEIRLKGRRASQSNLLKEVGKCIDARPGTSAFLPFIDLCREFKSSMVSIREWRERDLDE